MLKDGCPIYPLGSVQDTAIHKIIMKDQAVETKKFSSMVQSLILSSSLQHIEQGRVKEVEKSFNELLANTADYIFYSDSEAKKREAIKGVEFQAMINLVNSFSKKDK